MVQFLFENDWMMKRNKIFSFGFFVSILLLCLNVLASSDIGYTINRGTFSVTVRFGFDDKFENNEPNKLNQTFMTLTQWVWDNKKRLSQSNVHYEVFAQATDSEQSFFILHNTLNNSEKIHTIRFSKGKLAESIIQEISKDMGFKPGYSKSHTLLILISTKEHDLPDIFLNERFKKISPGYFSIGAIPGGCHNPVNKIQGILYNCAFLFWADDPVAKAFQSQRIARKDNVPLTRKSVKRYLGEIH